MAIGHFTEWDFPETRLSSVVSQKAGVLENEALEGLLALKEQRWSKIKLGQGRFYFLNYDNLKWDNLN